MAHGDGTIKLISKPGEPERYEINVSLGRDKATGKYRRVKRVVACDYERALIIRENLKNPERLEFPSCDEEEEETFGVLDSSCGDEVAYEDKEVEDSSIIVAEPVSLLLEAEPEYVPPSRVSSIAPVPQDSFSALVAYHVATKKLFGRWAASTEHSYWHNMSKNVLPYLGAISLCDFSTRLIEEYYYQFMLDYRKQTGRSGAGILAEVHRHLKATLETAVRNEIIAKNPCTNAERPKYERPERGTLDVTGLKSLLGLFDEEGLNGFTIGARLGLCAGFRPEESLGLSWRTVDVNTGTARIVQAKTRFETKGPKSKSSKRMVVFDERTSECLRAYKVEQARTLRLLGINLSPDTFVMTGRNGMALGYESYKTWWRRFREKHGVYSSTGQYLTLHEMRHTYCSLLLSGGAPVTSVSKAIGHRDAHITCEVYAHALPGYQQELAQTFAGIVA